MVFYCLTSVFGQDSEDNYYLDERSSYASSNSILVGVRTKSRLHIQNVVADCLPQDAILLDSNLEWFLEMLKLFVTKRKSKFVIADHSRFPIVLELVGRMFGHVIVRYCGSDMLGAAFLLSGWKKFFGINYAVINEFSLAQKVICNNARSFKFHCAYRRAFIINSAIMPIKHSIEDLYYDVIFVGGLEARKGVMEFLRELDGINIPLKVALIGDGSLKNEVQGKSLKIKHEVCLLGNIDKRSVHEIMSRSGALFLQSASEGFPRAITEALCFDLTIFTNQNFPGTKSIEEFCGWNFLDNRTRNRVYNSSYSIDAEQYMMELYA